MTINGNKPIKIPLEKKTTRTSSSVHNEIYKLTEDDSERLLHDAEINFSNLNFSIEPIFSHLMPHSCTHFPLPLKGKKIQAFYRIHCAISVNEQESSLSAKSSPDKNKLSHQSMEISKQQVMF